MENKYQFLVCTIFGKKMHKESGKYGKMGMSLFLMMELKKTLKRTPLFEAYQEEAKIVPFHGWEMPVQFSGIINEHETVRTKAGLFDVSHMGEIELSGPDALALIQKLTTNDASSLDVGEAQYSLMCYEEGGTVDDLLVYRLDTNKYWLVINASNIEKDEAWIREHAIEGVFIRNISDETVLLALQGPLSEHILQKFIREDLSILKPFQFFQNVEMDGASVLVSRTGYTGEDGFELYFHKGRAISIWEMLLKIGKEEGLIPCGLGARDTLRLEAKLCLYGQELSTDISPITAGVGFAVKENKGDFIGRETLIREKKDGPAYKVVGIEMVDRGIPRSGYPVFYSGTRIGEITSGTYSPTLNKNIGLARIDTRYASLNETLQVEIRGKHVKAVVVKTPFYKKAKLSTLK